MTNKEIREKIDKEWFDDAEIGAKHLIIMVDAIQNETRKSERERVIGEIDKWANSTQFANPENEFCNGFNAGLAELKSKLNELRK